MTENAEKKTSTPKPTSFSLNRSVLDRLKHATRAIEVTKTAFVEAAITQLADRVDAGEVSDLTSQPEPRQLPAKGQAAVVSLPGLLDGLSDDQYWTIQNLVEILKQQPQGSIFRSLDLTLQLAITEYRKTRSQQQNAADKPQTPREGSKLHTGSPLGPDRITDEDFAEALAAQDNVLFAQGHERRVLGKLRVRIERGAVQSSERYYFDLERGIVRRREPRENAG